MNRREFCFKFIPGVVGGAIVSGCGFIDAPPQGFSATLVTATPSAKKDSRSASASNSEIPACIPEAGKAYWPSIQKYAEVNNISPLLIAAVILKESSFNPKALNTKSAAKGLMQLMPDTAKETAVKLGLTEYNIYNPDTNIRLGTKYLADMIARYGSVEKGLLAYYSGPGNVDKDKITTTAKAHVAGIMIAYESFKDCKPVPQNQNLEVPNTVHEPVQYSNIKNYDDFPDELEHINPGDKFILPNGNEIVVVSGNTSTQIWRDNGKPESFTFIKK